MGSIRQLLYSSASFSLRNFHNTARYKAVLKTRPDKRPTASMRACFALFLVVTTLVAVASGSSVNLRASQKIQSSDVVQDQTSGRELRGDLKTDEAGPDDEERLNLDFVKKLASKIKGDPLKSFAKKQANYVYSTRIFDDLLAKKFDPDTLFVKLKLNIPHNQANRYGVTTGKYRLFVNFRSSYVEKFPTWTSKLA